MATNILKVDEQKEQSKKAETVDITKNNDKEAKKKKKKEFCSLF